MAKFNTDSDNRGNRIEPLNTKVDSVHEDEIEEVLDEAPEPLPENLTIRISKALHRKIRDSAREESVTIDEMISEMLA